MPDGGRLVIETFNTNLDAADIAAVPGLAAGDYVVLSVSDTGVGMTPEVKARAFEPFFTTKGTGRGNGLGLATIYGFVRQSGGNATIYSEVRKGTTVNLYLPRAAVERVAEPAERWPAAAETGQGETVLVVEDDDRVRRLTAARLKTLGYRVLEAANGAAALKLLNEVGDIDLIFTDLVMPGGMSGLDLARRVREEHPDARIILTSGYSAELMKREQGAGLDLRVLRKPYRQGDLARAFREALGNGGS
jgi:CheY-like chemotaxis protein